MTLTHDQQKALEAFIYFLADPAETVFVLKGYSGTGKTTLVTHLLDQLPQFMKTIRLLQPSAKDYEVELTATTNKAAEVLSHTTGQSVATIHSLLGLRVSQDFKAGTTTLTPSKREKQRGKLIFIDEASYIDSQLLSWIFKLTEHCKIVFMGDPAQLTPVKSNSTPVFETQFKGAMLSEVVRNTGPILDLSTRFRHTVESGEFFSFTPDGEAIQYLPREEFNQAILTEFSRPDWRYQDSKILGWTNKCAISYNHAVSDTVKGDPDFQVGDYAICNKFLSINRHTIKTDQLVCITGIEEESEEYGVRGHYYTLDNSIRVFGAKALEARNARLKRARAEEAFDIVEHIENRWVDLRAAYASTINKAQGSTYDRVFIDLDDVRKCNSGEQIARMLYVGVSRARHQVTLTGDIA